MLVNKQDLKDLNSMLVDINGQIDKLGKFKNDYSAPLFTFIDQVKHKITTLETQIAENSRVADLVLIDVKTLFRNSLTKV